jgi:penicillin amidase
MMRSWKYDYDADSEQAVFFEIWYDKFYKLLWDNFYSVRDSMHIYSPDAWRTNLLVLNDQGSAEFDIDSTSTRESFADIVQASFSRSVEGYYALNEHERQWGTYRQTTIRHLANIPAFSRTLTAAPGHGDALNATTRTHGPSWRMVVHLTEPIEAFVVYPGGQSGNPGSPYYDLMIPSWEQGSYYTAHYLKSPADLQAVDVLNLKPTDK